MNTSLTLYPPQVRPAFLLARTHFILRKKERSISYSAETVTHLIELFMLFYDCLNYVGISKIYLGQSENDKAGVL